MKPLKFLFPFLLVACASAPVATAPWDALTLPALCQQGCTTPYGQELGSTPEGIRAFSNCQPACVFEKPSQVDGTYAGIEWQCVEFARRWLISTRKITFPSIDYAADLWNKVPAFTRVGSGENVPVKNVTNGAGALPRKGDLLIYAREFLGTGHVAVVLSVDRARRVVRVGEENFLNQKWPGAYSREVAFTRVGQKFWLLEPYLLGWKTF